ncbi:MAG: methyltransferase [Candidatus Hodarchaeales archaeon]
MELKTSKDIHNMLHMYISSAALGTALELGLFWLLIEKPLKLMEISQKLNIASHRCKAWLKLLTGLGLIEEIGETYVNSQNAKNAILEAYKHDSWEFLAKQVRLRYPAVNNLSKSISQDESVWLAQGLTPPNWSALFLEIKENYERAEDFTKLLFDFHRKFAQKFAQRFDLTSETRLLDLGGGSGVLSLALLEHNRNLSAVVVDIENVCKAGRVIADNTPCADRITYHAADFLQENLPVGFDLILQCDVGPYTVELFRKLWGSLNIGGRLVILSNFDDFSVWINHPKSELSFQRLMNSFSSSLEIAEFTKSSRTTNDVKNNLLKAGFAKVSDQIWEDGTVIVQGFKGFD